MAEFKLSELRPLGKVALTVFKLTGILHRRDFEKDGEQ